MKKNLGTGRNPGRRMGSLFIRMTARLASFLPLGCLSLLGNCIGALLYFAWKDRRGIALGNLRLAFGEEKSKKEIKSIARRSFQNLLVGLCEGIRFVCLPIEHLERRLVVRFKSSYTWWFYFCY